MAKLTRVRGAVGNMIDLFVKDTSSTIGGGINSVAYNTTGLVIGVKRSLDSDYTEYTVAGGTIENITTIGTWSSPSAGKIRFKQIGTKAGYYQIQFLDSWFAATDASRYINGYVKGVTNMMETQFEIELVADDNQIAKPSNFASMSLTAGGLVDVNDKTGFALSTAGISAIWDKLTSGFTTAGSVGKALLDKIFGISGQVAAQSDILTVQNSTRVSIAVPSVITIPSSGSATILCRIAIIDTAGNPEAPDSTPTIQLLDAAGSDVSARLSVLSNPSTGVYTFTYNNDSTHTPTYLQWIVSVVEGGVTIPHLAETSLQTASTGGGGSAPTANENAAAVWAYNGAPRTLTVDPPTAATIATAVWLASGRSLDDVHGGVLNSLANMISSDQFTAGALVNTPELWTQLEKDEVIANVDTTAQWIADNSTLIAEILVLAGIAAQEGQS